MSMKYFRYLGLLLLLGLPVSGFAFSCQDVTEIPVSECEALVDFYDSTNGDNWTDNTGWKQTNTPCSNNWKGIWCSQGSVVNVILSNNGLKGTIPNQLNNLANLQYLYLNQNRLTGSIPSELGSLTSLKYLNLSVNTLSGQIPSELGNLSNLLSISLQTNLLTGEIPPKLFQASNLMQVTLYGNQLTGQVPATLSSSNLNHLSIFDNQLEGEFPLLPSSLQSTLTAGYLRNNNLCRKPNLDYNNSAVNEIPECTFSCSNVTEVSQSECETLVALYDSTDGDNWTDNTGWKQTNTPCSWFGVDCSDNSVAYLSLPNNKLVGEITSFEKLSVHTLDLSSNALQGSFPIFGTPSNLNYVDLGSNQLEGTVNVSNMTMLSELDVSSNKLTTITGVETIPLMSYIYNFDISSNQIAGNIYNLINSIVGNENQYAYFDLSSNLFEGSLPNIDTINDTYEYYQPPTIDLRNNQLSGAIPGISYKDRKDYVDYDGEVSLFDSILVQLSGNSELCRETTYSYSGYSDDGTNPFLDIPECKRLSISTPTDNAQLDLTAESQITLSWENIADAQQYSISICNPECNTVSVENATSYILQNAQQHKTYTWKVQAVGSITTPGWSEEKTFSTFGETDCSLISHNDLRAACPELIALYETTSGDNWTNNTGWKKTNDICSWYGITCEHGWLGHCEPYCEEALAGTTYSVSIYLDNNNLKGEVPLLANIHGNATYYNSDPSYISVAGNNVCVTQELQDGWRSIYGYDEYRTTYFDDNNISICGTREAFSCSNVTEIPQTECEVLVKIYDDLGGDNWTNNAGWKQTNNLCTSWYNLGCKNGHVTDIALENNNLSGVVPN
ncbi:MAG: leucine-rich repeat domain-containing protein, partial [Thiotrichaceae bacterium]|nr:leucine-rich repeat domain-containing protein [Thiotrichaceae bacterium]